MNDIQYNTIAASFSFAVAPSRKPRNIWIACFACAGVSSLDRTVSNSFKSFSVIPFGDVVSTSSELFSLTFV